MDIAAASAIAAKPDMTKRARAWRDARNMKASKGVVARVGRLLCALNSDNSGNTFAHAAKVAIVGCHSTGKFANAMSIIDSFEKMLAGGKDNPLLRFTLGNEYLKINNQARAIEHLRAAVIQDPGYSAAWKILGKALTDTQDREGARSAYASGIAAATAKGDKQAAKEMAVFMKRLTPYE